MENNMNYFKYLLFLILIPFLIKDSYSAEYFVATYGLDSNDGLSWSSPLLTITNAVAKSSGGDTITVSNGLYTVSSNIVLSKALTLRSFGSGVYGGLANASNTIIKVSSGFHRSLAIKTTSCIVDGFSMTGGGGNLSRTDIGADGGNGGAGFYMSANSLVRNCIVTNNGGDNMEGAGVWMNDGTVSNCIIKANKKNDGWGDSGGIIAWGGLITHCQIIANQCSGSEGNGGGVWLSGGTIRNCLIQHNTNAVLGSLYSKGAGIYLSDGQIESCTIVSNTSYNTSTAGSGVHRNNGTIYNSIIYFNIITNTSGGGFTHSNLNTTAGFYYSCATNPIISGNGNISSDPLFSGLNDYTLQSSSPCVNTGTNQSWMTGAVDLNGNSRIYNSIVDMGAYEYTVSIIASTPTWSLYRPNLINRRNLIIKNQESPQ
jgi:hypothetical protein